METTQTASERITEEVTSWPGVTAGPGALRGDQPALLVEAQRRRRDAAAPRDLADRQKARVHSVEAWPRRLYFKRT